MAPSEIRLTALPRVGRTVSPRALDPPPRRIYPGKGSRFVTRGGQLVIFAGSKVDSLYHQRKKPAKLVWTQAWRRMHKKLNVEAQQKRKTRRVVKVTSRGYSGMDATKLKETKRPAGAGVVKKDPNAPKVVVQQVRARRRGTKKQTLLRLSPAAAPPHRRPPSPHTPTPPRRQP